MRKILLAFTLLITIGFAQAQQVSHQTGFYPGDSLFFKIDTTDIPVGYSILYSINSWDLSKGFSRYYGDSICIKNRNYTPNSWENTQFSRAPYWFPNSEYYIDTLAQRGLLLKTNRIQILLVRDQDNKVMKDSVYHIGFGVAPIIPCVFNDIDSSDLLGDYGIMVPGIGIIDSEYPNKITWNYAIESDQFPDLERERYEKPVNVQILANSSVVVNQNSGIRISGNSSVHLMNKSTAVVARREYGQKMFKTDIYDGINTEYKWLNFRTVHNFCTFLGANEIGHSIMKGLKLGEVPFRLVIVFNNDSYWNLSYMQDKTNQYTMSRLLNVDKDSITYGQPINSGFSVQKPEWYYGNEETITEYGFFENPADTSTILYVLKPDEGLETGRLVKLLAKTITIAIDTNLTQDQKFDSLQTVIEIDQFFKTLSLISFIGDDDKINNNIDLGIVPRGKIFPIVSDFDNIGNQSSNFWNYIDYKIDQMSLTSIGSIISIVFNSNVGKNSLMRSHQDLLNSQFLPHRIDSICNKLENEQSPFFQEFFESWGGYPNGGCHYTTESGFSTARNFFYNRNTKCFQQMTDFFQSDSNYDENNLNTISVNFDHVLQDTHAWLKINTLTHTSNWSGRYFPKPTIVISVPFGYYVAEFPDSSGTFELYLVSHQQLTLQRYSESLPIELVSFNCNHEDYETILSWETASEFNSDYFALERSEDGIVFDSVGTIPASGYSNTPIQYHFTDKGSGYYRLKQVDSDGFTSYSKIIDCGKVILHIQNQTNSDVTINPNPADDFIFLKSFEDDRNLEVSIINIFGKMVFSENNTTQLNIDKLPHGLYIVRVIKNNTSYTGKFIKN